MEYNSESQKDMFAPSPQSPNVENRENSESETEQFDTQEYTQSFFENGQRFFVASNWDYYQSSPGETQPFVIETNEGNKNVESEVEELGREKPKNQNKDEIILEMLNEIIVNQKELERKLDVIGSFFSRVGSVLNHIQNHIERLVNFFREPLCKPKN